MIPHTQFLGHVRDDDYCPLPLNQGMRGWFWTGHYVWTDEQMPGSVLYKHFVANERDWNCPINQTQLWPSLDETPGELRVQLTHNMPSFQQYLVRLDDGPETPFAKAEITWKLQPGPNRLQIRAENVLGLCGPASSLKLDYQPSPTAAPR
jgi:hypothetical protein